jgi:hypothetical protein
MTEFTDRNKAGCCCLTGKPLYEIISAHPHGHPFEGEPRQIGNPLDYALNVHLLLKSGSIMQINIHSDHIDEVVPNISRIHKNILAAFEAEAIIAAAAVVVAQITPEQAAQKQRDMISMVHNIPIGIYCIERVKDRGERDKAARSH